MKGVAPIQEDEKLNWYLQQLEHSAGIVPNTPEYALVAAKLCLQFYCGGRVVAYRLVSGWEPDGFRAKYQVLDDEGGTFEELRARLAGRSDVQAGDVEIDYIEPLGEEPAAAYQFE